MLCRQLAAGIIYKLPQLALLCLALNLPYDYRARREQLGALRVFSQRPLYVLERPGNIAAAACRLCFCERTCALLRLALLILNRLDPIAVIDIRRVQPLSLAQRCPRI